MCYGVIFHNGKEGNKHVQAINLALLENMTLHLISRESVVPKCILYKASLSCKLHIIIQSLYKTNMAHCIEIWRQIFEIGC
jgi:hypothetical protein